MVKRCPKGSSIHGKGDVVVTREDGKDCRKTTTRKTTLKGKSKSSSSTRDPALPVVDTCPEGSSTRMRGKLVAYTKKGKKCRRSVEMERARVLKRLAKRDGVKTHNHPKLATRIGKVAAKLPLKVRKCPVCKKEIPKGKILGHKCVNNEPKAITFKIPKRHRVPDIRINSPTLSLTSTFTLSNSNKAKYVIYLDAPNVKPGKGDHERGSPNPNLAKIPGWRSVLSDMHVDLNNPIVIGGKKYASVEHYCQAMKFKSTAPTAALRFTLNSGSSYARDPKLAIEAAKRYAEKVDPEYEKRRNTIRKGALFNKFIKNKIARAALYETGDATLMIMDADGTLKRDHTLEQTRTSLGKGYNSANKVNVKKIVHAKTALLKKNKAPAKKVQVVEPIKFKIPKGMAKKPIKLKII